MKKRLLFIMTCLVTVSALATHLNESGQGPGLGQLGDLPNGTEVTIGYPATVLYKDYFVTFVKDETGYAAINMSHYGYLDGDVIPAGYVVKVGGTNGFRLTEVTALSGFRQATDFNQPLAQEVTINQINSSMLGHLVVLRNVVLNAMNRTLRDANGNTIGVYQEFAFPTVEGYEYEESDPTDEYVIVVGCNTVYLTNNIFYYGLGYDYSGLPDSTEVRMRFDETVLYQHGDWLYVKDMTGYGLVHGSTERSYITGDVIPAGYYATKTMADGEVRLENPRNMHGSSSEHLEVVPEAVKVEDINHEHWAHLVTLEDVTVSGLDGDNFLITDTQGNTCQGCNSFEQPLYEGHYQALNGIVGSHEYGDGQIQYRLLPILETDTAEVRTIAEMLARPAGAFMRFSEPLTAIYQNGPYLYVRDCEGGEMLVYGEVDGTFTNGDIIADAVGRWSKERLTPEVMYHKYYGPVVKPISGWDNAGHVTPVMPAMADIIDIDEELLHHYVKVPDIYHYVSDNMWNGSNYNLILAYDNEFNIELPEWSRTKTYDMTGFVAYYYPSHWRIYPIEVKEHVATPEGDLDGDGEVKISDVNLVIDVISGRQGYYARHSDVNGDGEVNIADVNCIVNIILSAAQ